MQTAKPVLGIETDAAAALDIVRDEVRHQGWHHPTFNTPSLVLTPFFVFSFTVFVEEMDKEKGHRVLVDSETGMLALNAVSGEIDESASEEIVGALSEATHELSVEQAKIERPIVHRKDVEKIAQIKTAELKQTDRKNTLVSNIQSVLVPHWQITAIVEEHELAFDVSAASGSILEAPEIPERGKDLGELAEETIGDLRHPSNWIDYLVGLVKSLWNIVSWPPFWELVFGLLGAIWRAITTNRLVQWLLVLVAALWFLFGGLR